MNFREATENLKQETEEKFLGLYLEEEKQYLHFFVLEALPEIPQQIDLFYSGCRLFEMHGEEGNYALTDIPSELEQSLMQARFRRYDDIADLYYMIPAQVLYTLFPEMPNPSREQLCPSSKQFFAYHAGELIRKYWK
ncbi:hypothetical protein [Thiomicrorhabdus sp. 6S3-12]|uniref:hypothetical protein n=1 Tax=Thiomicrorhabdus sp. 6S3-12 TaxID=2819681 RepID=UPI001AAD4DB5|nr:hypothetical protein [Thiomicrorhabdus sp. 6S3-12]MBO1923542.1 hypothetical protein [Thiomicrorhabdus sp. 6S3-12]